MIAAKLKVIASRIDFTSHLLRNTPHGRSIRLYGSCSAADEKHFAYEIIDWFPVEGADDDARKAVENCKLYCYLYYTN
jgi:hypothetical protein